MSLGYVTGIHSTAAVPDGIMSRLPDQAIFAFPASPANGSLISSGGGGLKSDPRLVTRVAVKATWSADTVVLTGTRLPAWGKATGPLVRRKSERHGGVMTRGDST